MYIYGLHAHGSIGQSVHGVTSALESLIPEKRALNVRSSSHTTDNFVENMATAVAGNMSTEPIILYCTLIIFSPDTEYSLMDKISLLLVISKPH
jgi:hypothetical protein